MLSGLREQPPRPASTRLLCRLHIFPFFSHALYSPLSSSPILQGTKNPDKFKRWRSVEIKHGRIAMMASTGYIAQECLRFPGYLSTSENVKFSELPNGIAAFNAIPTLGKWQILLAIGLMEVVTWRAYDGTGPWDFKPREDVEPGDWAGELWVRYPDPETKKFKLNIELNNGRAAMLGVTGMLMHDHITGSWIPPGL